MNAALRKRLGAIEGCQLSHHQHQSAMERMAASLVANPCKELNDRMGPPPGRNKRSLERLLAAIERAPAETTKQRQRVSKA